MPSRWDFTISHGDIEELPNQVHGTPQVGFDGYWKATFASGERVRSTVVCISGTNVWHKHELFATLKRVTYDTCVLIMKDEDVRGQLSSDGGHIDWDDGDLWPRVVARTEPPAPKPPPQALATGAAQVDGTSLPDPRSREDPEDDAASVLNALLRKDVKALLSLLERGGALAARAEVDAGPLFRALRWDPEGAPPQIPLLVTAILLQWPEGVEACLRHGADANGVYRGPFLRTDGRPSIDAEGASILRVALSVRGPPQSTICQHLLSTGVRCRTFQSVRRKCKDEMDFVTAALFDLFTGPFSDTS